MQYVSLTSPRAVDGVFFNNKEL